MNNKQKRRNLMDALNKLAEVREIMEELESNTELNLQNQIEQLKEDRIPSLANSLIERLQGLEE